MISNKRRVRIVEFPVEGDMLNKLFRGDLTVIEGLPDDVSMKTFWHEPARQVYCFMLESEEFPVVEEGEEAPVEEITIAERRVNASQYWVCPNCMTVTEEGDVINEGES